MKGLLRHLLAALPWVTFLAALLYIFTLNFRPPARMDFVQRFIVELTAPVSKSLQMTYQGAHRLFSNYITLHRSQAENQQIREQLAQLQGQLTQYHEAYLENLRLRRLLDFKDSVKAEALPAQIVGHDPTGWFQTVFVDKGSADGVEPDMPVVNDEGVVGRILDVSDRYSRVLLVTDPGNAVDALIQRNRIRGILAGKDTGTCLLKYVRGNLDVQVGDLVITSGQDGIYPKGLRLGKVRAVFKDPVGLFQMLEVDPAVRLNVLEEVLVLKSTIHFPKE
jgi:rod shape-determining protein MreC